MQKKDKVKEQFLYLGRYVDKDSFRAFVYSVDGKSQKLARSFDEFEQMVSSGLWLDTKPGLEDQAEKVDHEPKQKVSKLKHGANG